MVDRVCLYRAPTTVADAVAMAAWLAEVLDVPVDVNPPVLEGADDRDTARAFADARVVSPYRRSTGNTMLGTVRYEERVLADPTRGGGVLYDGFAVQELLRRHLPAASRDLDRPQLVLLDRAIATWGDHDGRWHKRVIVLGKPAVISVPGLYEAPAKPAAYYRAKQGHAIVAGDPPPREILEHAIEGDFLIEDDPRTTDAIKGYALQAVHYLETGEAFCHESTCRLFNAHRQEELVRAQLDDPDFCERHAARYSSA